MTVWAGIAISAFTAQLLCAQLTGDVKGTVTDASNGAVIAEADVRLANQANSTKSDRQGHFVLHNVMPGAYTLQIQSEGHRDVATDVTVNAGEIKDIQVSLIANTLSHFDTVTVKGTLGPRFETADGAGLALGGADLKNLSTVLADDPLRAVQALPGVTSNDDFEARFSLRGADFNQIGVYVDGILLHNSLHSLEGTDLSGSASVFNGTLTDRVDLYEDAYSEQFASASAAAVNVHMRDGDPDRYTVQLYANMASAGLTLGGPLGPVNRCSWIGAFRKSYLQYLLSQTLTDPSMAFGIEDGEGRISCRANEENTITLQLMDSHTDLDRSSLKTTLGANALMMAGQQSQFANMSWHYSPNSKLLVTNRLAWIDDKFTAQNPVLAPLGTGSYTEKVWDGNVSWMWNNHDPLNAGSSVRVMRDSGFVEEYDSVRAIELLDKYRGSGILSGGFLQQAWSTLGGHLRLSASGRWDHHSVDGQTVFSPQLSTAIRILPSLEMQLGWGQYAQFPEISVFGSNLGRSSLSAARSTHAMASLEQRLGSSTRVRLEFYDRQDRDLLSQPYADPRVMNGTVFIPPLNPLYENSLRSHARGIEIYLQRSSTKGVSGWLSYSYGHAWMNDTILNSVYPSDWDQRHTISAYASYRIRPSVNVSARWSYGSGFPVPGYLTWDQIYLSDEQQFSLTDRRNTARLAPYQRLDFRVNKTWQGEKWKTSLYGEVLNVTNKTNQRFGSLDGYDSSSRAAWVSIDTMFPILPSVGVVFER